MHRSRLHIGATELAFHGVADLAAGDPLYAPFVMGADGGEPASRLQVELDAEVVAPGDGPPIFDSGGGWRAWRDGDGYLFEMPGKNGPLWRVALDAGFERAQAWTGARPWPAALLRYPFDQILTVHHGVLREALLLHAAGFVSGGSGIVFAGVSGAGKSTVSRLVDGALGLSDDRVMVRRCQGEFRVFGTPWSGEARLAANAAAPLRALCFLAQSATATALEPLAPAQALAALVRVVSVPWYDERLTGAALATCESLLAAVPCYTLHFQRDAAALAAVLASPPLARAA